MELSISGRLGQDAAEGEIGSIGFDGQGKFSLEVPKDGRRSEGKVELTESCTCLVRPGKLNSLASQSSKRRSESRKFEKPRKDCTSFTDLGMGQFRIADTLGGSMPIPALETI